MNAATSYSDYETWKLESIRMLDDKNRFLVFSIMSVSSAIGVWLWNVYDLNKNV